LSKRGSILSRNFLLPRVKSQRKSTTECWQRVICHILACIFPRERHDRCTRSVMLSITHNLDWDDVRLKLVSRSGFKIVADAPFPCRKSPRTSGPSACFRELSKQLENEGREGREGQAKRPAFTVAWPLCGLNAAKVADIAAAINCGIRIDGLAIKAWQRNSNAVRGARHRGEIANDHSE